MSTRKNEQWDKDRPSLRKISEMKPGDTFEYSLLNSMDPNDPIRAMVTLVTWADTPGRTSAEVMIEELDYAIYISKARRLVWKRPTQE